MRAGTILISLRVLTWCCVILLAVLSLLPAQEMVRTVCRASLSIILPMPVPRRSRWQDNAQTRDAVRINFVFWICAGILESLQHFSPGRHPSIADFAASALGAWCGGLAVAFLSHRLWKDGYPDPA